MLLRNRFHDEEAESRSFDMRERAMADPVEALEDALCIVGRNADSMVLNLEHEPLFIRKVKANAYIDALTRIFDGVIEDVEHCGAKVFIAAQHARAVSVRRRLFIM
jgi:hypothetical protein